jgi:hypothetical protein
MHYTARTEPLALLFHCHYALHSPNDLILLSLLFKLVLSRSCNTSVFTWLWNLLSCLYANLWISCLIVGIFRSLWRWSLRQYLTVTWFGISVFCLCCLWLHTPRAGCHTSRWVLELVCVKVIYYAQKAEISSQVASTFFFYIWGRAPSFSFLICYFHRNRMSRFIPRYFAVLLYGMLW